MESEIWGSYEEGGQLVHHYEILKQHLLGSAGFNSRARSLSSVG